MKQRQQPVFSQQDRLNTKPGRDVILCVTLTQGLCVTPMQVMLTQGLCDANTGDANAGAVCDANAGDANAGAV